MPYYIIMKYRDGKVPVEKCFHESPKLQELELALSTALKVSKEDTSALVLVETDQGRIAAAFIWGDRIVPFLHRAELRID